MQDEQKQEINIEVDMEDHDTSSQEGEEERIMQQSHKKKPINAKQIKYQQLTFDSCFAGGNLAHISCKASQYNPQILCVQFKGNSDVQGDVRDKCWFYFSVSGLDTVQYSQIDFKWTNANMYRKFIREKKYKPYIAINLKDGKLSLLTTSAQTLQDQTFQAEFSILVAPDTAKVYLAVNIPYNLSELDQLHDRISQNLYTRGKDVYYHRQLVTQSCNQLPIYLFTITSANNILSYEHREFSYWPKKGLRPHKMKNRLEIIITGRVHPSQVSSSWFIEGIVENLVNNPEMAVLLEMFIFRIFPIINPDGVQNGNYRLDNLLQNLNRFYGHSKIETSPSIFIIEKLIEKLRQSEKLFMYLDVHGHTSPKASFIYGNYNTNLFQSLENKAFCKILDTLNEGFFDHLVCEFSKRNMKVKEKYDEHSKEASGRVFAYRENNQQDNIQTNLRNFYFVEHSYTFEVMPYVCFKKPIRKNNSKTQLMVQKSYAKNNSSVNRYELTQQPSVAQIIQNYKMQGQNFLLSILELLGINFSSRQLGQEANSIRKVAYRQLLKNPQHYTSDRNKRFLIKEIDQAMLEKYCLKWDICGIYEQIMSSCPNIAHRSENTILFGLIKSKKREKKSMVGKVGLRSSHKSEKMPEKEEQEGTNQKMNSCDDVRNQITIISHPYKNSKFESVNKFKQIDFEVVGDSSEKTQCRSKKPKPLSKNMICKKKNTNFPENGQMEERIRKLIFRHKTENQPFHEKQVDSDLNSRDFKTSKEHKTYKTEKKINYHLLKLKKTQDNDQHEPVVDFNDISILEKNKNNKNKLKTQNLAIQNSMHLRMQEIVKKISTKKQQQLETISYHDLSEPKKLKSSDIVIKKPYKFNKDSVFRLRQDKRTIGYPSQEAYRHENNTILPPVLSSSIPDDHLQFCNDRQYTYRTKLQGLSKIKSKKKISPIGDKNSKQQNINDIVISYKGFTNNLANRADFIGYAKKMIQDRKIAYNGKQSPKIHHPKKQTLKK